MKISRILGVIVMVVMLAGLVLGAACVSSEGEEGPAGVGIQSVVDNEDGTFTLNMTDGSSFTTPDLTGPEGPAGEQGPAGVGILDIVDNGDGTFTINMTDGSSFTTANLTGPKGDKGDPGLPGASSFGTSIIAGDEPGSILFDGTSIWVVMGKDPWGNETLVKIRPSDGEILGTFTKDNIASGKMVFDGTHIWVGHETGALTKVDPSDGETVDVFNVDVGEGYLQDICFDGTNIWVLHWHYPWHDPDEPDDPGSGGLIKLGTDGEILGATSTSFGGRICYDGTSDIWVAGGDTIERFKASDLTSNGTISGLGSISDMHFDGNSIWVAEKYGYAHFYLTKIRVIDNVILGRIPVSLFVSHHVGIICSDGVNVWVACRGWGSNPQVVKIRASDGRFLGTFPLVGAPASICFDDSNVWVTESTTYNITKLPEF